MLQRVDARLKG